MSIIKKIPVDLSEMIHESNVIVEVKYLEAFVEEVNVKGGEAAVPVAPFKKRGGVFALKKTLKNTDKINLPQTIRVPDEGWRRSLSQHKEAFGGVSKSYKVKEYSTEVKSIKQANIIFLYHFQGTFELVAKNAFESMEALEKVTMLITAK